MEITSIKELGIAMKTYLFGILIFLVGMPISRFMMSLGLVVLILSWFMEGDYVNRIKAFFNNKIALLLSSVLFLHFLGLIHTTDFQYGLTDIKVKAPLFVFPFILSTMPALSKELFRKFIKVFIFANLLGTMACYGVYAEVIPTSRDLSDIRNISAFISHIRLSLMVALSFFLVLYFALFSKGIERWISIILGIHFISFLWFIQSGTGIVVVSIGAWLSFIYILVKLKYRMLKLASLVLTIALPLVAGTYIYLEIDKYYDTAEVDWKNLPEQTENGNRYYHDSVDLFVENGNYLGLYHSKKELSQTWSEKSQIPYMGEDNKGHLIRITLVRYLNSKGLTKDRSGIEKLTNEDLKNIENGMGNYLMGEYYGFRKKILETIFEFESYRWGKTGDGHSIIQRVEYWKGAIKIIGNNFIFGTGTGDVDLSFRNYYETNETGLSPQFQHRAHNQYLTFFVAFGVVGLVWFIIAIVMPLVWTKRVSYSLFIFTIIVVVSFLWEDTLETQAGVSFYAFLNSFFLFGRKNLH